MALNRAACLRARTAGVHRVCVAEYGRFYEEDERIMCHAADSYHGIDIRRPPIDLVVHHHAALLPIASGRGAGMWLSGELAA